MRHNKIPRGSRDLSRGRGGVVVDALATYAFRKLPMVQWKVPGETLAKVIWAIHTLPILIAVHMD